MPHQLVLFDNRHVIGILSGCQPLAAPAALKQKPRKIKIFALAGDPVELNQRQLDLGMSRGDVELPRPPDRSHEVGAFDRHIEQRPFARRLIVRDGSLVQMPHIVQLVTVTVVALQPPAVVHPLPGTRDAGRVVGMNGARRVEISVRLLRRGDLGDQRVQVGIQRGIRRRGQTVSRAFDHLIDIRIVERGAPEGTGH